ncbi:MAG: glycine cleavage system aminomethyltransferase GcvT [Bacteroidales bacterium]|nr:glycine cleavage system aminomethyltransferase GcvT [Bacteroidales bacterium]
MEENLLKTCLYDRHVALGALMSPFGGFIMPIQYSNITDEHNSVRHKAGMFDVSHMGEIFVSGPDAEKFVDHIFSNKVAGMEDGKILYGMMLHPDGNTVDDLLVYKEFEPDHYLLVVNASNIAKDHEWICAQKEGYDVEVVNASDSWGQIALQGPDAEKYAVETLGLAPAAGLGFYTYYEAEYKGERMIVSRTGYTGEDGFEIYASHEAVREIWDTLLEAGVVPCGLGCRDTLRFEAGLPLYGHELSDDISPLEAGLGMFAKVKDKEEFIGREALVAQKEAGLTRKSVGIELQDKAIPRAGYPVEADGVQVGVVTTGYRSISTDRSVCVAMVDKAYADLGTSVQIRIRKKVFPGIVTKRRFYETNYKK